MRGADGDQPSRSLTILASVAAGPRCSRTSLALSVPLSRLASRVGGGSAFYVR